MLRVCSKEEFLRYADFVWELAQDLTRSGYHTYCDRIKTREDFMERRLAAFDREAEEILLFEQEGKVQGVIHYYWIPEDHYLQTICFNTNTAAEQALAEFMDWIGRRFPGYDVYLGFPAENRAAVTWLAGQGFEIPVLDEFLFQEIVNGRYAEVLPAVGFQDCYDCFPEGRNIKRLVLDKL